MIPLKVQCAENQNLKCDINFFNKMRFSKQNSDIEVNKSDAETMKQKKLNRELTEIPICSFSVLHLNI